MVKRSFFLLLCLSLYTLFSMAGDAPASLDCANAISTPDINTCTKIELDKQELKLNQTYQRVLSVFDALSKPPMQGADKSKLKKQLIEAQRLWVRFRKADCNTTYTFWSDGTIRGVMYLSCMIEKTNARIKELEAYEQTY